MSEFKDLPIENLPQFVNEDITSGVSETEIYFASAYDILEDPIPIQLGEEGFDLQKAVVIEDDITFIEGRGFFKITVQTQTGEVKDDLGGNKGNKKAKQMFDFFMANNNEGNLGFVDIFRNVPLVVLVRENSRRIRKIGTKFSPAYFESIAITSGKGPDDDNGAQCTISSATGRIAPIYKGNITVLPPSA